MMGMENLWEYRGRLFEHIGGVNAGLGKVIQSVQAHQPGAWFEQRNTLAHLRDMEACEYLPALRRILDTDTPLLVAYDWRTRSLKDEDTVDTMLSTLLSLRQVQVDLISRLSQPDWSRVGRHPVWGLRTFQWWVERSLSHLEKHLRQLQDGRYLHD
jgi:hypothetical protein